MRVKDTVMSAINWNLRFIYNFMDERGWKVKRIEAELLLKFTGTFFCILITISQTLTYLLS